MGGQGPPGSPPMGTDQPWHPRGPSPRPPGNDYPVHVCFRQTGPGELRPCLERRQKGMGAPDSSPS